MIVTIMKERQNKGPKEEEKNTEERESKGPEKEEKKNMNERENKGREEEKKKMEKKENKGPEEEKNIEERENKGPEEEKNIEERENKGLEERRRKWKKGKAKDPRRSHERAFKNPRDQLGMRNLLLQAFPTCWQDIMDVYQNVTERPLGYTVLYLHPTSYDRKRAFSHLLTQEGFQRWHRRKRENVLSLSKMVY